MMEQCWQLFQLENFLDDFEDGYFIESDAIVNLRKLQVQVEHFGKVEQ